MKIKDSKGRLTSYGLACGYIEQREICPNVQITLWQESGPCYHVRAHNFNTHTRLFWKSFTELSDARKFYDKAKKGNGNEH